ncbi:MAG: aspartate kinase [Gammaproteobacteria bacterium]|nr:aspartate kinase [Gammaproteobacteria bacterium]
MGKLVVHKYGGTSMGSVERIQSVAKRVAKWYRQGYRLVVVPSAMSGETDKLLNLAKQFQHPEVHDASYKRALDMLASTGEQVSSALLAVALLKEGVPAVSYAGWQVPIRTDSLFTKARIVDIERDRIDEHLALNQVVIITGFQGVDKNGHITTLGRGGSDTSAVAIAVAIKASECLIYTDVDGVYSTDPRLEPKATLKSYLSFEEMLEMASLGSKVLHLRSVEFAMKYNMPVRVLSSFTPADLDLSKEAQSGTLITFEKDKMMEQAVVSSVACSRNEAKISVFHVPDKPGVAFTILQAIAAASIDVDMIVQNVGKGAKTDFSFTVARGDYTQAIKVIQEIAPKLGQCEIQGDDTICKVSIVGIGMRSHAGVASTMFETLSRENINILMISTSEIKTSVVIEEKYMELAVRVLHQAFGLHLGATPI